MKFALTKSYLMNGKHRSPCKQTSEEYYILQLKGMSVFINGFY